MQYIYSLEDHFKTNEVSKVMTLLESQLIVVLDKICNNADVADFTPMLSII